MINEINDYKKKYPDKSNEFNRYLESAEDLNKKINQPYSLVFIAEKGTGKTTLINFLLGLNYESEKQIKNKKKKVVEEEVLETGAGATTTFEVEIVQSKENMSHIIVEPYKEGDLLEIFQNFSGTIFKQVHKVKLDTIELPPEINRACRNMTLLKEETREEIINGDIKKQIVDLAKELAQTYGADEYDLFEKEIISRAHLKDRTTLEFKYEGTTNNLNEEKKWIKEIFRDLNLVKIDNVPLPKKVIIGLSREIFDFSKLEKVDKIIDTRGLEPGSVTDRRDIRKYFDYNENYILFFVDEFKKLSNSLITLLNQYVYDEDLEVCSRMGYLVNYKEDEPGKVIGYDGEVEDEEEGIHLKFNNLIQSFTDNRIFIEKDNIIYGNPRRSLNKSGSIEITGDDLEEFDSIEEAIEAKQKKRNEERINFLTSIFQIISHYHNKNNIKKDELLSKFSEFKSSIDQVDQIDLNLILDMIKEENYLSFKNKSCNINDGEINVFNIYRKYIEANHHSKLNALNYRRGIYNEMDIFCEGSNKITRKVQQDLQQYKDFIIMCLDDYVKDNKSISDNQRYKIDLLKNVIVKELEKAVKNINTKCYKCLEEEAFEKSDDIFWTTVQDLWGSGKGYKNNLVNGYNDNLYSKKIHTKIECFVENIIIDYKETCMKHIRDVD